MSRWLACLWLVLTCAVARAESAAPLSTSAADWTGRSAITQPLAHGQVALFSESRVGVHEDLQLGFHVAGLAALTAHASALYRVFAQRGVHLSLRLGASYPMPTLWLLSGKGAGALLPADTKPAQALLLDPGLRASIDLPRAQLLTLEAALPFAAKFTNTNSPLLDFPLLYPRFAALNTLFTARFSLTAEGVIAAGFRWVGALDSWLLPVVSRGFALEPRFGLGWAARRWVTLELGYRASYARYPVGLRFHNVPYFDLRVRF